MVADNEYLDKQMLRLTTETECQKSEILLKIGELNNKLEKVKDNL